MMLLVDEPGTRRMFVNTMQGMLYSVSYDGKTVTPYIDINDAKWGNPVEPRGTERGFQSFAFHPQFSQRGAPGYGKFYTWADTSNMTPTPDATPLGEGHMHDTVLLEWTRARRVGRHLRRRRAARDVQGRAAVPESQRRSDRVQPADPAGRSGFRPALRRPRRWRQRGPATLTATRRVWPRRSARSCASIRSGGTARTASTASRRQSVRQRRQGRHPRRDLRLRRAQPATLLVGCEERQHVRRRHRPEQSSKKSVRSRAGANLGWNKWEGSYRYANRSRSARPIRAAKPG